MINWQRRGRIVEMPRHLDFAISHVQLPIAHLTEAGEFNIYFSTRNKNNQALGAMLSLEQMEVKAFNENPVLSFGKLGTFDDVGVMPTSIVDHEGDIYMYYIGWNVRNTIPYHNSIGLAIKKKGEETFERFSDGPLIERTYKEPYFAGTACVLKEGDLWRMWYLSCTEWVIVNGKPEPRYLIRYAESNNGKDWQRDGTICIDYLSDTEAIAAASVVFYKGKYRMMFCTRDINEYRTNARFSYKLKYAESENGIDWNRFENDVWNDNNDFEEWESDMQAYPNVFVMDNKLMMLYNGNGFGRTGIGLAEAIL